MVLTNLLQGVVVFLAPTFLFLVQLLPHSKQAPVVHDASRLFWLPFEADTESFLIQGYDGPFSHQNQYALDFVMPQGTYILAARGGRVVRVDDGNTESCPLTKDCPTNGVYIQHDDASTAWYIHMQLGGPCVMEGQRVELGDVIGRSGNVGISTLPHVHFELIGAPSPTLADVGSDGIPAAFGFYTSANTVDVNHCESE